MEALAARRTDNEEDFLKVNFQKFIRKIELSCEKTLLNRRNQVILRQKLKQHWLLKSRIIPPSFSPLLKQPLPPTISIQPYSLHHTKRHLDPSPALSNQQYLTPETSPSRSRHCSIRKTVSCDRVRGNWKLQFRRDQLNILKYARNRARQGMQPRQANQHPFKVRKFSKKFQQFQSGAYSFYNMNLPPQSNKDSCRSRLKTTQNGSESRYKHAT